MSTSFADLKAAFMALQNVPPSARSAWLQQLAHERRDVHAAVQSLLAFEARPSTSVQLLDPPADEPSDALLLGTRYEDRGFLGLGGMGEVRRAFDPALERTVALKCLRSVHARQADPARRRAAIDRFEAEARIQASLRHPAIVPVFERGKLADGRPYLTMAEVHGETLRSHLHAVHASDGASATEGWTLRRLLTAFEVMCRAVAHAHERGILHLDLKPSNAMIDADGAVWVLDWGLARTHSDATGILGGTPSYMAPEQVDPDAGVDARTDIYALGAVLYALLSGRDPHLGMTPLDTLAQLRQGAPPEAVRHGGPVPPEALVTLCGQAMHPDPTQRPARAVDLANAVRAWLEGDVARRRARALVQEADALLAQAHAVRQEAQQLQTEAEAQLAGVSPWDDEGDKAPAWALADRADGLGDAAGLLEVGHLQTLAAALRHAPDLADAHQRLATHYAAQHQAAEATRNAGLASQHEARLREHDRTGAYAAYLEGTGALTLHTEPSGATVRLFRYARQHRRLVPQFERALGTTPLQAVPLAMGSYLAVIEHPACDAVRYPVQITRQAHWDGIPPGAQAPLAVVLPPRGTLGEGERYVPAGWFASGGDPEAMLALPARRLWCDGFVMQRFAVTYRAYHAFLDHLVDTGREAEALRHAPQGRSAIGEAVPKPWRRDASGHFHLQPDEDGDEPPLDAPVMLVDWEAASAYAAWLAEAHPRPWRLPGELEWEKAARGVDGRWLPWGDHHDPSWSRVRASWRGRAHGDYGWVAVDRYPVDESVYGIRGLAGNARAWCVADRGVAEGGRVVPPTPAELARGGAPRVARGGSWGSRPWELRSASRAPLAEDYRNVFVGIRLVYSLPTGG